ncbi:hypothetical protein BU16DRAFT_568048 [Lophium mytilinum]|uniref:Uncharacterized protein n=1 Tax=Lophium mytilinum TaxID=390894 RepID=A0A6A6QBA3_9PEZI|nr:hypothetical protein BU16DRAFT_568048 [Lophium mytilinum]
MDCVGQINADWTHESLPPNKPSSGTSNTDTSEHNDSNGEYNNHNDYDDYDEDDVDIASTHDRNSELSNRIEASFPDSSKFIGRVSFKEVEKEVANTYDKGTTEEIKLDQFEYYDTDKMFPKTTPDACPDDITTAIKTTAQGDKDGKRGNGVKKEEALLQALASSRPKLEVPIFKHKKDVQTLDNRPGKDSNNAKKNYAAGSSDRSVKRVM